MGLVLVHGDVFKDGSRTSATFKMGLFAAIGNDRAYKQLTVVFACCCGNPTLFACKIKIVWKWPCFEGCIRHVFLFCRHAFTFFLKLKFLLVLLTFCFISKVKYKNENRYHCWFHVPKFIQYLKVTWLSAHINKIPSWHLLVQS